MTGGVKSTPSLVGSMLGFVLTIVLVLTIFAWWGMAYWLFSDLGTNVVLFDDDAELHDACFNGLREGVQ